MKKLSLLFAVVIVAASLFSCDHDESEITLKKSDANVAIVESDSDLGVTPVIIPGENNGGNRTCADVEAAFSLPDGYFLCGDKIDYNGDQFDGEFPEGLNVMVTDGKWVSFELDSPFIIGDHEYIVGAVIVKGGPNANVYYYPGGSTGDSGLSSPVNSSGKPAGLSNLSFCLIEKTTDLVIAMKTYLAEPVAGDATYNRKVAWAVSGGLDVDPTPGTLHIGYNYYDANGTNEYSLVRATLNEILGEIGTISARDYWADGVHYLEVTVTLNDNSYVFDDTYLYVGSLEGYEGRYYTNFPFQAIDTIAEQRVFTIDYANILL